MNKRLLLGFLSLVAIFSLKHEMSLAERAAISNHCVSTEDLEKIAEKFKQFETYTTFLKEPFICPSQMDSKWFSILQALSDILHLSAPEDAAPFSPAVRDDLANLNDQKIDWWAYFTKNAHSFQISPGACEFSKAYAFVLHLNPGPVHLCDGFFALPRPLRTSILLHEARHFDGFPHSECGKGPLETQRNCDSSLAQGGSNAMTIKANINLILNQEGLRGEDIAETLAMTMNFLQYRFNQTPRVELDRALYVENQKGEIFEWNPRKPKELKSVSTLASASRFFLLKDYGAAQFFTVFPLDPSLPAYRNALGFRQPIEFTGLFATTYSNWPAEMKSKLRSVEYGAGFDGMIMSDRLILSCSKPNGRGKTGAIQIQLAQLPEPFSSTVAVNGEDDVYLIGDSGKTYRHICQFETSASQPSVSFEETPWTFPAHIQRTVKFEDRYYGLSQAGELFILKREGDRFKYSDTPVLQGRWLEIALKETSSFVEEALNYRSERFRKNQ